MRVLQICNKPPYPPVDGGTLAMNCITQGLLSAGCEVMVFSACSDKHPVREHQMTEAYVADTHFDSCYIDLSVRPLDALIALMCGESYHVKRFDSDEFRTKLISILKENTFDLIHVESVFLTPYVPTIRKYSSAKIVLRAHNVEHQIWRRVAQSTRNIFKKMYLRHLSLTLRAYECEHINDYDAVACITDADARMFKSLGCRKPIIDLPFGIIPDVVDNISDEENSLFHLGSMDWMPNVEGIEWFIEKVWPKVHKELPQVHFYLAGRKMPGHLMNMDVEGVTVVGEVPDAMYFIGSKKINVVPLLSGSGIRVKIIEAMSVGKVVITTSVGAEGIGYTDGENILIANTPEEFVFQIRRCVEDSEFCQTIGNNAARLIADKYNPDTLTERLVELYQSLL